MIKDRATQPPHQFFYDCVFVESYEAEDCHLLVTVYSGEEGYSVWVYSRKTGHYWDPEFNVQLSDLAACVDKKLRENGTCLRDAERSWDHI